MRAKASDVRSATPTVIAKARKNTPVTPVIDISGRNTTMGVIVEPTSGTRISRMRAADSFGPRLPRVPMQHDVLHYDNSVVNHQSDRSGQTAQCHQVEALSSARRAINVTPIVAGITSPATSDVPQSLRKKTMMKDARMSPRRMASRTLSMDSMTNSDWS